MCRIYFVGLVVAVLSVWCGNHQVKGQGSDPELCHRRCASELYFYRQFVSSASVLQTVLTSCTDKCGALPTSTAASSTTQTTSPPTTHNPTSVSLTTEKSTTRTSTTTLECGIQRVTHNHRLRIVGGMTAAECEYPWMVFVSALYGVCAGAILDRKHVLTAAHCVKDTKTHAPVELRFVHVRAGSSSLSAVNVYQVSNITWHPQHDPYNKINDAAVLTLANELEFSNCIAPICLPELGAEPTLTDKCVVAGWGVTRSGTQQIMPDLQEVEMSLVDQDACQRSYGGAKVNDRTFCARDYFNGRRDSCQGDSGAPLMCRAKGRYVVYGIVSSGLYCAQPAFPGIYTKVSHPHVLEFITMAMGVS